MLQFCSYTNTNDARATEVQTLQGLPELVSGNGHNLCTIASHVLLFIVCYDAYTPSTTFLRKPLMWVTVNGTNSIEIDDSVVERVLNLYPEEELGSRPVFEKAFADGEIEFEDLQSEGDKILIPWQLFLLSPDNFNVQMTRINELRAHKVSTKLVAKRRGIGDVTSKRIIDRLIRQQNFVTSAETLPLNDYVGSLARVTVREAVRRIVTHFEFDMEWLWGIDGKGNALDYLIAQVDAHNINVSRGVLTHKILPTHQVVPSSVYRNTSGFAIRDERLPFVFLPGEVNPDEVESRQIYTLIYLLAVIGLDQYEYILEPDFKAKMLSASGMSKRLHDITTELLIPSSFTNTLRGTDISLSERDALASQFKVSPSALVITLRIRNVISKKQYEALMPPPYKPRKRATDTHIRSPKITTAVKKFCGKKTYEVINRSIANKSLSNIEAQYLIFGAVNKKGFQSYKSTLKI